MAMWWLSCAADPCLEVTSACAPLYEPTWDGVYANTVAGSCALGGCHLGPAGAGGLTLGDSSESAYDALMAVVLPFDAACSTVVAHLEPNGLGDMPPGVTLSESERCAVRQWIDAGAIGP